LVVQGASTSDLKNVAKLGGNAKKALVFLRNKNEKDICTQQKHFNSHSEDCLRVT
jgi:hypothetical protein